MTSPSPSPRQQITQDLRRLGESPDDRGSIEQSLYQRIYDELRAMARGMLRNERAGHTLQATELVHEAYLRLVDGDGVSWESRAHFFGAAARAMRRILVDHARRRLASKRGGEWQRVTLDPELPLGEAGEVNLIAIDEALERLGALDERMVSVVELRVFAGLKMHEIAAGLGVSERTVDNDWAMARRWLRKELDAS